MRSAEREEPNALTFQHAKLAFEKVRAVPARPPRSTCTYPVASLVSAPAFPAAPAPAAGHVLVDSPSHRLLQEPVHAVGAHRQRYGRGGGAGRPQTGLNAFMRHAQVTTSSILILGAEGLPEPTQLQKRTSAPPSWTGKAPSRAKHYQSGPSLQHPPAPIPPYPVLRTAADGTRSGNSVARTMGRANWSKPR